MLTGLVRSVDGPAGWRGGDSECVTKSMNEFLNARRHAAPIVICLSLFMRPLGNLIIIIRICGACGTLTVFIPAIEIFLWKCHMSVGAAAGADTIFMRV